MQRLSLRPGLVFLVQALQIFSVPVVAYHLLAFVNRHAKSPMSNYALVAISVLLVPMYAAIHVISGDIADRRAAAALGARPVPRVKGKYPGNLDILQLMMENSRTGYPADGIETLVEKHGHAFDFWLMWEHFVITTEPHHIKLVLATDFQNYVKGERFQGAMGSVLGSGVFNSDGDMWKFHRAMTRPFFSRDRISHFELFDRYAANAINQIKERIREGYAVDFQDVISRFTLDAATDYLFGSTVDSLACGLPYPHHAPPYLAKSLPSAANARLGTPNANAFAENFLQSQFIISQRERMGWVWPLLEIFGDKTKGAMKVVNAFVEPIIADAVNKRAERLRLESQEDKKAENEVDDDESLLEHLIKYTSDPTVLKDETINIMIAGRDTTAATLTFVIYFLSMYPKIKDRLREEVLAHVGPSKMPTYDDIKGMKYLRAVLNETLRLYPVVPFNIRESIHATTWPSSNPLEKPIYIPAGCKVPYSVFLMHRRKDLWGEDAEEFDPDRFLDERLQKYLAPNPFIFLPFNAGPRICLGQQFAYNEMSFMVIRILQNFSDIALDLDSAPPESLPPKDWAGSEGRKGMDKLYPKMHLTMYNAGGLWVKMKEVVSEEQLTVSDV